MSRFAIVLTVCLIGASTSVAEAQESSSAPVDGTRVELPQHGFATTLPEGWLVICPLSEEALEPLETLSGSRDVDVPLDEQERAIVDKMAALFTECQFVAITLADEGLEVTGVCKADAGPLVPGTFDSNVMYLSDSLSAGEDTVAITTSPVDLPAGPAVAIDVEYRARSPRHWANYLVDGDEVVLVITRTGPDRPEDDWLSVVETFEFLPSPED